MVVALLARFPLRFGLLFIGLAVSCLAQVATVGLSDGDEFIGPFASWTNVKTAYGAAGDGVTDDTAALQNAFNHIGTSGYSSVLYLPAGTYRITSGLTISPVRQGISVIGQDPASTTIKWAGQAGAEMLYLNGVSYSKFSRITWDGSSTALTALDFGWDGLGPSGGSTYVENSDEVFKDLGFGIRGGTRGFEDSEHSILRCQFLNNTRAGISVENFNALDWYIWDSTFINDFVGVTNINGGGNFHVYGSFFQSSTRADIEIGPADFFSFRQNFSQNSNSFLIAAPIASASSSITLQSNTILDSISQPLPISNVGTVLMFDNTIRASSSYKGVLLTVADTTDNPPSPGGLVAIGNTVSVSPWYSVPNGGEVIDLNNTVTARSSINPVTPTMPGVLPNYNRRIFEVVAGTNAAGIQSAIDAAVAYNGQRPVVHLPASVYSVDNTVVIPVGSDVQLVGDGGGAVAPTVLNWTGASSGPLLRLAGPSRATLRDFDSRGGSTHTAILIENTDQSSGRVFMEQVEAQNLTQSGILVNGLDNAEVTLHDGYVVSDNLGIQVVGGPKAAAGQSVAVRTDMFAGLTGSNNFSYDLTNHGRLMSQDVWYEGGPAQLVNLSDSGTFTLHNAHIAAQDPAHGGIQQNIPTFNVTGFNGSATLLGAQLEQRNTVGVQGSGANTKVLAMGILGPSDNANFFVNSTSPPGQVALIDSRQLTASAGSVTVPDQVSNIASLSPFLLNMLAQTRTEQAHAFSVLPAGITDARLYRVSVAGGTIGVELDPGGPTSTTAPVISGVKSTVGPSSVTIQWNTDQAADSQVLYGASVAYGVASQIDATAVTTHSVTLNGLAPGTTSHFAVKSRSLSGYVATSADATFTTPALSAQSGFVTSFTPNTPRNNFTGWVGMKFTVGSTIPVITSLGRMCLSGNSGTHAVKLVQNSDFSDVSGSIVSISMASCTVGAFQYGALSAPIYLTANTSYLLVSNEASGGDTWLDIGTVTTTSIASVTSAVYSVGNTYVGGAPANSAFVPVDFIYSTTAPSTSLVSSFTPGVLRNNYSGYVGMSFTVGSTPLTVASLGRVYLSGNTRSHIVKLVQTNGADVPGGSVTISLPTGTAGQFAYTGLATPITLAANTAYYLVSQEANGGDQWYDITHVTGSSAASLNGPVYFDGAKFVAVGGLPGQSYVPVGLLYTSPGSAGNPLTVTITSPAGGATVSGTSVPVSAVATAASGLTVTSVQFQLDGQNIRSAITSPPYTTTFNSALVTNGGHSLGATVIDSSGNSAVASPVAINVSNVPTSVAITSPASGSTISGASVSVNATATAGTGSTINNVQFLIDGNNIGTAVTSSPYAVTLNSTTLTNGLHTLTAVATDSNGNTASSAAISVTASNSNSSTPFVIGQSPTFLRNNFTGFVGMQFTVGNAPIQLYALGRLFESGSIASHTLKLVQASTGVDVAGGSVSVSGGTPGLYTYSQLASPITLLANTAYYLVSLEIFSQDQWFDYSPVTSTSVATVNGPVYEQPSSPYNPYPIPGNSYVPVNFLYASGQPATTALFTQFSLETLRNNYTGYVGTEITIGASPMSVTSLGRLYLQGNSGNHILKLVQASTHADVPGGSVTISMSGGTPGQFKYAQLANPISLAANTAYYLVSQETIGGDQWYDYGPITSTSAASSNGPVYYDGSSYVLVPLASASYVPVNLLYTTF